MLKYQRTGCAAVYYMSCICAKSIPRACLDVNLRAGHYSLASADFVCCYRCAVLHVSVVQISRKIGSLHTHPAEPEDFVGHMPKSILKKCAGNAAKEKNTHCSKNGGKNFIHTTYLHFLKSHFSNYYNQKATLCYTELLFYT